jgi:hypothetical protein
MVLFFYLFSFYIYASELGDHVLNGNLTEINRFIENQDYYWKFKNGFFMLNKNELRLLRNTIFAKYGYIFNSPDLQKHFSQCNWYNGIKTNVDAYLTEVDKENIRIIQRIEAWYPKLEHEDLIGYWIQMLDIKRDPVETETNIENHSFLIFYPNGTFYLFYINVGEAYGVWDLENDKLIMGYMVNDDDYIELFSNYFETIQNLEFKYSQEFRERYLTCNFGKSNGNWLKISNTSN